MLSTSGWTEVTTTDGFEINIIDGQYIQVAEVRASDSKVTRWGEAGPANDGYTPQIPASGLFLTVTINSTSPPAIDSISLSVAGGSAESNYYYYKFASGTSEAPFEGSTLNTSSWAGMSLSTQPILVTPVNGSYVQVVETTASNVVLKWGEAEIK